MPSGAVVWTRPGDRGRKNAASPFTSRTPTPSRWPTPRPTYAALAGPARLGRIHRRGARGVGRAARLPGRGLGRGIASTAPTSWRPCFDASGQEGPRHYLLGGSPETLAVAAVGDRGALAGGHRGRRREPAVPGAVSRARWPTRTPASATRARPSCGSASARPNRTGRSPDWRPRSRLSRWPSVRRSTSSPASSRRRRSGCRSPGPSGPSAWRPNLDRLAKRYLWGNPRFLVAAAHQPGLRRGN